MTAWGVLRPGELMPRGSAWGAAFTALWAAAQICSAREQTSPASLVRNWSRGTAEAAAVGPRPSCTQGLGLGPQEWNCRWLPATSALPRHTGQGDANWPGHTGGSSAPAISYLLSIVSDPDTALYAFLWE